MGTRHCGEKKSGRHFSLSAMSDGTCSLGRGRVLLFVVHCGELLRHVDRMNGRFETVPLPETDLDFSGQPYSVSVLKVGYCLQQTDGSFRADGTITLITGPRTIVVDTGGPWDRDFLLLALKDRGLDAADVDIVVGTHGHSDHIGNLSLFSSALVVVGQDVSQGDTFHPNGLSEGHGYTIDQHVSDVSMFMCVTERMYVICRMCM